MESNKLIAVSSMCIFNKVIDSHKSCGSDNQLLEGLVHDLRIQTVTGDTERKVQDSFDVRGNILTVNTGTDANDSSSSFVGTSDAVENVIVENEGSGGSTIKTRNMTEALDNFDVLLEIFNDLSIEELLKCRSVSHKWNEASSFTIRKRNLWHLNLNRVYRYRNDPVTVNKDFLQCLNSSFTSPFPCSSLQWGVHFELGEIDDDLYDVTRELHLHLLHAEANGGGGEEIEPARLMGPFSQKDVDELQIFEYLKLYGSQIKVFRIHCNGFIRVETICDLLLKQMPNLQELYFKGSHFDHIYSIDCGRIQSAKSEMEEYAVPISAPLVLNSLKCLEYEEPPPRYTSISHGSHGSSPSISSTGFGLGLLGNILHAAPHLERITRVPIQITDAIVSNGRMKLVKEVYINFYSLFKYANNPQPNESDHFLELLSRFSHAKPKIETLLLLDPYYGSMGDTVDNAVLRIVQSSRSSLKKLILPACYLILTNRFFTNEYELRRPRLVLPNVEHVSVGRCGVQLCDCDGSCNGMPSPECTLHEFLPFPNLKYLRLDIPSARLGNLFQNSVEEGILAGETITPFSSLKVLELSLKEAITPVLQHYLPKFFPNISKMIFRDERNNVNSYRTQKIVLHEVTELLPGTVEFVEIPHMGLHLSKTETQNHILWTYSKGYPFSSMFENNIR